MITRREEMGEEERSWRYKSNLYLPSGRLSERLKMYSLFLSFSVPSWSERSLSTKRGPSSTKLVVIGPFDFSNFVSESSNMYRWWRKKMKSRWQWNVATWRYKKSGLCGNSAISIRPMVSPRRDVKLLRMSSDAWFTARLEHCSINK